MEIYILLLVVAAVIVFIKEYIKDKKTKTTEEPGNEELEKDEIQQEEYVSSVKLVKKSKGGVLAFIGFVMFAIIWLALDYYTKQGDQTLASAIRSGYITNPMNLIAIATFLSFFGWVFHDASTTLLAVVAAVGAIFVDTSCFFLIVPGILLVLAYVRMNDRYTLAIESRVESK